MQMALRRLRKFARQGAAEELDIDGTIRETAKQGILMCSSCLNVVIALRC
jgi:uncharacterized protein with von Willebrand factor type A (vWA) domain